MSQGPREVLHDSEDEVTLDDLPSVQVPTYEQAPPTLEMRPSPFHPIASRQPTVQGMPTVSLDPKITSMPAGVAIVPPVIVGAPGHDPWDGPQHAGDLAGPTEPDGYPLTSSWEGPTDPDLGPTPWIDAGPTDVSPHPALPRKPTPVVPPPGSPTFEISQSLEVEAAQAIASAATKPLAAPKPAAKPRRYHAPQPGPGPHAPTQVLPALKKDKPREGSDWPLLLGLLALGLVIAGLVGAVAYGVMRSVREPPAPPARVDAPGQEPPAR